MSDLEQVPVGALWILAVASSIAVAAAVLTLPRTGRKWEMARRAAFAVLLPVVGLAYAFGREARRAQVHSSGDDPEATALFLFSVATLTLASLRVIYARYLQRAVQLARSGGAVGTPTGKQATIFLLTLLIVFAAVAASLAVGLSSMAPMASG